MRIAYAGLSTPVAYDYQHTADKAPADRISSPNPILFGATGMMLLFDEIWFISKSMCPQSMRALNFVRFLDEDGGLTKDNFASFIEGLSEQRQFFPHSLDGAFTDKEGFKKIQSGFLNSHDFRWDNHTHKLEILGQDLYANSGSQFTLELDRRVRKLLSAEPVEQVYNPFWYQDLTAEIKSIEQTGIVQELVLRQIPTRLMSEAPRSTTSKDGGTTIRWETSANG
jgi:hypothetical protein